MQEVSELYEREYSKPIMGRANCLLQWGMINEAAADPQNHLFLSPDNCKIGNLVSYEEYLAGGGSFQKQYREKNVLNNGRFPTRAVATFERDFWRLDGSMPICDTSGGALIVPDGEAGWVSSSISGDDGAFAEPPALEVLFSGGDVRLSGLVLSFCRSQQCFAVDFEVSVYLADTDAPLVISVQNNGEADCEVAVGADEEGVGNVKKLELTIKKWNKGGQRARLEEVEFGLYKVFDGASLVDVTEHKLLNQVSTELPISTLDFTVVDKDNLFDADNPGSLSKYLTSRQPVKLTWIQDVFDADSAQTVSEKVSGGVYYLKEWKKGSNEQEYRMVAESLTGFLDEPYYKGVYYPQGKQARALIAELLDDIFPGGSPFHGRYDVSRVPDCKIRLPIPVKLDGKPLTYRDGLLMLAQAAGCVADTDRRGNIVVKPLDKDCTRPVEPLRTADFNADTNRTFEFCYAGESKTYTNTFFAVEKHTDGETSVCIEGADFVVGEDDGKSCTVTFTNVGSYTVSAFGQDESRAPYRIDYEAIFDAKPKPTLKAAIKEIQCTGYRYAEKLDMIPEIVYNSSFEFDENDYFICELQKPIKDTVSIQVKNDITNVNIEFRATSYTNDVVIQIDKYALKKGDVFTITIEATIYEVNEHKRVIIVNADGDSITFNNALSDYNTQSLEQFLYELSDKESYELEIKRNFQLDVGDKVSLQKKQDGTCVNVRITEITKSLANAKSKVACRKLAN